MVRVTGPPDLGDVDVAHLALTREKAMRLAGLSARQVDYWASTGLVGPTIDRRLTPGRRVRLYEFQDVLELLIAAELRKKKISVQHIRQIVKHLRDRGYDRPLTQVAFAVLGGAVYFKHDDGTWEGDVRPDQIVIHEVLDLQPLRLRIATATRRDESDVGHIERRRGALGNKPVIAGTRIPVATVQRYLDRGRSVGEIIDSFPSLTAADVEAVRDGAA